MRIDDVQHYTLPSIAQLQLPAGAVLKGSWESIYRSLLPFREDSIDDGHRIRSISELPHLFLKVNPDNGPMTRSVASPSIFDLRLVIYHFSCPCNLGFLKLVGPMCAKRGWSAFILIRRASTAPTTSSRHSSTSSPEGLPTFVLTLSGHFIGRTTRTSGRRSTFLRTKN